jgi:hypothetical protein
MNRPSFRMILFILVLSAVHMAAMASPRRIVPTPTAATNSAEPDRPGRSMVYADSIAQR